MSLTLISVKNLSVYIKDKLILDKVNFSINSSETLALIGPSGCGKSITATSIMRLLPRSVEFGISSEINLNNIDLLDITERHMREIRKNEISMIFQDPATSLNPVFTIGYQLLEITKNKAKALELLRLVKLPNPQKIYNSYPHELSGGMKQRVMIAIAIANEPKLLIADEPTTALDVTIQKEILKLLKELQTKFKMAILLITHDLSVAVDISDNIAIMENGKIKEINSIKYFKQNKKFLKIKEFAKINSKSILNTEDILNIENLKVNFKRLKAVNNVSFSVKKGETLAIVGESGSGKTTTGKAILDLLENISGKINFKKGFSKKDLQIVFQDPYSAINPKLKIIDILREGMQNKKIDKNKQIEIIDNLLKEVGLEPEHKYRYPHEFSGGQRQRICIARALTVNPKILILDEPTSALDAFSQKQVLDLLLKLQKQYDLTYIFITHDMSIVSKIANRVIVMYLGKIVETGPVKDVFLNPKNIFTRTLLNAVPDILVE